MPNQPKMLHLSDNDNARSPFNFPLNIIKKSVRVIKRNKSELFVQQPERAGVIKAELMAEHAIPKQTFQHEDEGIKTHTN